MAPSADSGAICKGNARRCSSPPRVTGSTLLNVLEPYPLGRTIDRYIIPRDLPGLAHPCLVMLGVYAASSLRTWRQSFAIAGAA
ncbi:MAG TPA: hypothetical protein VIL85_00305, partial [Thermomicrobiales bacterium]